MTTAQRRRFAGRLLGYSGTGRLTAHVDFTAVQLLAARRGFRTVALTAPSESLVIAGLDFELRPPGIAAVEPRQHTRAPSDTARMPDPRHTGCFRVLVLARSAPGMLIEVDSARCRRMG